MTTIARTLAELQAWLDTWNEDHAAPSANSVVDFLGIELAEPEPPVGQRRRSPDGVEVIKTDGEGILRWRRYVGVGAGEMWFSDVEVADWEVITDAFEVAEDVTAAVTLMVTETGESIQESRGIARRMAAAGLLVGALPDAPECDREHLPEGHVPIDLSEATDLTLDGWVRLDDLMCDAARAELARRQVES